MLRNLPLCQILEAHIGFATQRCFRSTLEITLSLSSALASLLKKVIVSQPILSSGSFVMTKQVISGIKIEFQTWLP